MKNLFFGIKNGAIISIDDVNRGLKCDCMCPSCGEKLVAKKGTKMIHHFAHASTEECEYGYETTLHLLAKDVFSKQNYFILPNEIISINDSWGNYKTRKKKIVLEKVDIEKREDTLKPDIVAWSNGIPFYIEMFVTHKVDEEKKEKIRAKKINTIEIDLSSFKEVNKSDKGTIKAILENIFTDETEKYDEIKYWIYSSHAENLTQYIIDKCGISTVHHGFAFHTEFCPADNARNWKGKKYANVIDDCIYCDNYCGQSEDQSKLYCRLMDSIKKNDTNQTEGKYSSIINLWAENNGSTIIVQRREENFFVKMNHDPNDDINKYSGHCYGQWSTTMDYSSWKTGQEIYMVEEPIWKLVWPKQKKN